MKTLILMELSRNGRGLKRLLAFKSSMKFLKERQNDTSHQSFSNPDWVEAIFQLLRQRFLFAPHSPQLDPC